MESFVTRSLLITGPSTGAGKTMVARALTAALRQRGVCVAALKPIETGVDPRALDALALARAAGDPALADFPGAYREPLPLAPYAASLERGAPAPDLGALVAAIRVRAAHADVLLVEGAGGLLAPLDAQLSIADLALRLELPLALVARDELGVISHLLTCAESARARGLCIAGVVLTRAMPDADASTRTNRRIVQERLACPVLVLDACPDDDAALAACAERNGLLEGLGLA